MRVAEMVVVYTDLGVSAGMLEGVAEARLAGRPVEYRSLNRFAHVCQDPHPGNFIECPCCGALGATADSGGEYWDGQALVCGCDGAVSVDDAGPGAPVAWINVSECGCDDVE
jgi:hypothetical protein